MARQLVTGPAELPLTLEEAKLHLRVDDDFTTDDAYISTLIAAAAAHAESFTNRALVAQTWDFFRDAFPAWTLDLPLPPTSAVASVKYTDTEGVQQTLAAAKYKLDLVSEPARLTPAFDEVWPTTRAETNAVEIRATAGYGAAADVPQRIRHAMLMLIGHWYDHRESVAHAQAMMEVPQAVPMLLWPFRVVRF